MSNSGQLSKQEFIIDDEIGPVMPTMHIIDFLKFDFVNERIIRAIGLEDGKRSTRRLKFFSFDHRVPTVSAINFLENTQKCHVADIHDLVALLRVNPDLRRDSVIIAPGSRFNLTTAEGKDIKFFPIFWGSSEWKALDTWDRGIGFPSDFSILLVMEDEEG